MQGTKVLEDVLTVPAKTPAVVAVKLPLTGSAMYT
jgi:hypothetical protein